MDAFRIIRTVKVAAGLFTALITLHGQAFSQPEPRVQISALVVDDKTSEPIKEFTVTGDSGLTITRDPKVPGVFQAGLARNWWPYQFRIEAPGYAPFQSERFMTPKDGTALDKVFRLGPGGKVIGRVVRADNGAPIPDVIINSIDGQIVDSYPRYYPTCVTGKTDSAGRFQFERVGAGPQHFNFVPPPESGLVSANFRTDVVHDDVTDMEDLKLGKGSTINGTVVTTPGDVPVAGKEVNIGSNPIIITDADGRFSFSNLRNGLYKVAVPSLNLESCIAVEANETKSVTLRVSSVPLVIRFTRYGKPIKSSGRLARMGPNQSIIRFWHSDDQGFLRMENLSPGPWQLEGFSAEDNRIPHIHHTVNIPESGPDVELTLSYPIGKLTATVSRADGIRTAGATVRIRSRTTTATELVGRETELPTDSQGEARFDDLTSGVYVVSAETTGPLRSNSVEVAVSDEKPGSAELTLSPAAGGGSVVSTTLNYGSGKPIATTWCYLFRGDGKLWEHQGRREDTGIMRIEAIPPGRYVVQVGAFGYSVKMHEIEVRNGETVSLSDVLYQAGALKWTILDEAGNPVPGARCTVTPVKSDSIEVARDGTTNDQGVFISRGLFPGDYQLTAKHPTQANSVGQTISISPANLTQETSVLK